MNEFLFFALGWVSALLVVCTGAAIFVDERPRRSGFEVYNGRRLHNRLVGKE